MRKSLIILLILMMKGGWGKSFTTDYIQFELPPGWQCLLEGAEWVCQGQNKNRQKEAIIIMAAKEKGAEDTREKYEAYLKEKKQYVLPNRKTQISAPKYTKVIHIHDNPWVDSLHLASEVPGFYTRYLATTKGDLGIAVTFSVSKDHYSSYQQLFQKVIESMRVFAITKGQIAKTMGIRKGSKDLLSSFELLDSAGLAAPRVVSKGQSQKKDNQGGDFLFYILLLAAGVGFIIYKKKKSSRG